MLRAARAPGGEIEIPIDLVAPGGVSVRGLAGVVVDDTRAELVGDWVRSTHEPGFVGDGYLHDDARGDGSCRATFTLRARQAGRHAVEMTWRASGSRATAVPVTIRSQDFRTQVQVDQSVAPDGYEGFRELATIDLRPGVPVEVTISNTGTSGHVIVDAVRLRKL